MREKKDKIFAGIHVQTWLYDMAIKYSEKYNVGHYKMCRDGLRRLVLADFPPYEEPRYINPHPNRRKKL